MFCYQLKMVNRLHLYKAFLVREHSKRFTDECLRHLPIHTPMAEATIQVANLHISSSLGFSVLLKDTSTLGDTQLKERDVWTNINNGQWMIMKSLAERNLII